MKTLILGLGNPILGDDGVGWRVAQEMQARLDGDVEVDCLALGGLRLMERMIGYERVILIDALVTPSPTPGRVHVLPLSDLPDPSSGHTTSAHDVSLQTALQMAAKMGFPIPQEVWVVGVEIVPTLDFSETLSPEVEAALPQARRAIQELAGIPLEEAKDDIS
ncbi:MAG: hydrogenase maturation protease [Anaerolineales bacterium]